MLEVSIGVLCVGGVLCVSIRGVVCFYKGCCVLCVSIRGVVCFYNGAVCCVFL